MEQLVLGIFQEHLSKFIIGFRKEQVNANLLNGKGEIKNVELNCAMLNEQIMRISPYIELESVHVSKLSFHVSSWTNLRQSPICIDIEHVTAKILEPLHYLDRRRRRPLRQMTRHELAELIREGTVPKPRTGRYNLLDRIIDNLTVEIQSIDVTFQPAGRFKTRRVGLWTPPALRLQLFGVRLVSVTEFGHEASPDEVWRHNHHHHHHRKVGIGGGRDGNFLIYKKLETEYRVSIVISKQQYVSSGKKPKHQAAAKAGDASTVNVENKNDDIDDSDEIVIPIVSSSLRDGVCDNQSKVQVQFAFQRRIRDGEYLAVQIDTTIPVVKIEIVATTIPHLAHLVSAITYLFAKDRAFEDPLRAACSLTPSPAQAAPSPTIVQTASRGSLSLSNNEEKEDVGLTSASILDIAMADGLSESSDDEDDGYRNDDEQLLGEGGNTSVAEEGSDMVDNEGEIGFGVERSTVASAETIASSAKPAGPPSQRKPVPQKAMTPGRVPQSNDDRPVLVLPNGIILHDKVSISISVHHVTIRGTYRDSIDGHVQIVANGVVVEAIWPPITQERGGYLQASVSYLAIQERFQQRIRPLLIGGVQYDNTGPIENPAKALSEVGRDETFPLYEDRSIRPDPIGLRHTFPAQALGFKLTFSYLKKLGIDPADLTTEAITFLNEVGVDRFEVVLDAAAWCRLLRFALNIEGGGFDPRWDSGDWSDILTTNMLLRPGVPLNLDECLQSRKQIFLDENQFLSSDLFNATVRVSNTALRIPAVVEEDVRSCDIHLQTKEIMVVVSSALPRSLMNGAVDDGSIEFPHDPSDAAYKLESAEDPSNRQRGIMTSRAISTFRAQLTVRGFSIRLTPIIPFRCAQEPEQLLLPSEMTMIVCFEGEPPADDTELPQTKVTLLTSIIAHRFELNIDFDRIASAIGTASTHVESFARTVRACVELFAGSNGDKSESEFSCEEFSDAGEGRIRKTLRGRKILVRRQIMRSRETGGLNFAFQVHVAEIRAFVWRQHVPRQGPLRSLNEDAVKFVPLLCLLDTSLKKLDLCLEISLRREDRLLVLKCTIEEVGLSICNFGKLLERTDMKSEINSGSCHTNYMINLLCFKNSNIQRPALAFRAQEILGSLRSWSVSTDLSNVAIDCHVDEVETTAILFLEALLMPTWKHPNGDTSPSLFPSESVGALLMSVMPCVPSLKETISLGTFDSIDILPVSGQSVDLALRSLITRFLPGSMDVLLVRFALHNVLLALPSREAWANSSQIEDQASFGVQLCASEFFVGFFASDDASQSEILNVFARGREKWSSIVLPIAKGLHHSLKSRQSVLSAKHPENRTSMDGVVDDFDFSYSYHDSKIAFSISDDVSIGDTDRLGAFFVFLLLFKRRCMEIAENAAGIFQLICGGCDEERKEKAGDDESHPISVACASTVASMQSARIWLRRASESWSLYDRSTMSVLSAKDKEIALLRLTLFAAERERLNALALVDSQACGWLNFGAAQRLGQRGVMTSTLIPHWAVLRRSLLLLYSGPGQHDVVGHIHTKDASLRDLRGGQRKRDLKRAFAIVEKNESIHFVVAVSDAEYINWVQKIRQSIRFYSPEGGPDGSEQDIRSHLGVQDESGRDLDSSTNLMIDPNADCVLSSSNHGRPLGGNLQGAVTKGKGRNSNTVAPANGTESLTECLPSSVDMQDGGPSVYTPSESITSSDARRQQLRTRLAGVGHATKKGLGSAGQLTKNRFGVALQVAKQKGKQAVEKRRNQVQSGPSEDRTSLSLSTDGSNIVGLSSADQWPCPSCTFLNSTPNEKCAVCECLRPTHLSSSAELHRGESLGNDQSYKGRQLDNLEGSNDFELLSTHVGSQSAKGPEISAGDDLSASGKSDRSVNSDLVDDDVQGSGGQRLGMKQRFGAAVLRAKAVRSDRTSSRSALEETPAGAPDPVKLRNISVGNPLLTPMHPFKDPHHNLQDFPLKRLAGMWFVRVEKVYVPQREVHCSPQSDLLPELETLGLTSGNYTSSASLGATVDDQYGKLDSTEAHRFNENPDNANGDLEDKTDINEVIEKTFQIDVFHRQDETFSKVATLVRRIPDILHLHTSLSQSLTKVPLYRFDVDIDRECARAGTDNELSIYLGLTTIDKVRLTGKFLGSLLERSQTSSDKFHAHYYYQANVISEFLNVMLDSLLPVDGLALLSEFLQLTDASTRDVDLDFSRRGLPIATYEKERIKIDENERLKMADAVLSFSSLCENELLRAEKQGLLAERLSRMKSQSNTADPLSRTLSTHVDTDHHHSASNLFRDAMHSALMAVMEERDEAHARMLSAEVLHVHEMEQQRKKTASLSSELELLKQSVTSAGAHSRSNQSKMRNDTDPAHRINRQHDTDAELISLCQQLAGEISARTSASLEILRLKESRKLEQENEAIEKDALKDEIAQLKQQLSLERKRSLLARRESGSWRESFKEALKGSADDSKLPSPQKQEFAFQADISNASGL